MKVYRIIASLLLAQQNCKASGSTEWLERHTNRIFDIVKECLPSGGGFDNGTALDAGASSPEKIVFRTSFHHMSESGMYDGWTEHTVRVYPSLASEFRLTISGCDRNGIKEYIYNAFFDALREEFKEETAKVVASGQAR
jgi:hypothetical protein